MTTRCRQRATPSAALAALPLLGALALAGCVSVGGGEPPDGLLTLTSTSEAPPGAGAAADAALGEGTIAVITPEAPAKLDVLRVPVAVSETEIAYLKNAFWVEKPARLFRRLIGEALRARSDALVIDGDVSPAQAATKLRGTLLEMGYDAPSSSVIVRYDAIRIDSEGQAVSRRFEASEAGVIGEPDAVGPALNRAANTVAGEVADWITGTE